MSSVIEKKPLLIRIPGEKEPNELPISASAVGYDVNTGNYIYYSTGSDNWVAVPSTTVATASFANNADLLDNLDSTAFARLSVTNIFTANQIVTGSITVTTGFSGSLTRLSDGTPYLLAGTNITLSTGSSGAVTINSTAAGASTTNYFLSLNGTANGISTNIGSFYAASAITLSTGSVAYIGGSSASETAILKLSPIGSATATVTWTRTNLLGSVALTGSVALSAGWYDLILDVSGAMQTAFARGLYLTT